MRRCGFGWLVATLLVLTTEASGVDYAAPSDVVDAIANATDEQTSTEAEAHALSQDFLRQHSQHPQTHDVNDKQTDSASKVVVNDSTPTEEIAEEENQTRVAAVIQAGSIVTIRSLSQNRRCVETDEGWKCNRKTRTISSSQRFTVESVSDNKFSLRNGQTGQLCSDEGHRIVCDHQGIPGPAEKFEVKAIGLRSKLSDQDTFALVGGKADRFCVDRGDRVTCDQRGHSADEAKFQIKCIQSCSAQQTDVPILPTGAVVTFWNRAFRAFIGMKGRYVKGISSRSGKLRPNLKGPEFTIISQADGTVALWSEVNKRFLSMATDGLNVKVKSGAANASATDQIPSPKSTPSMAETFRVVEIDQKKIALWNPLFKQFVASATGRKIQPSAVSADAFLPKSKNWQTNFKVRCLRKCETASKANLALGRPTRISKVKNQRIYNIQSKRSELAVDGLAGNANLPNMCTAQVGEDVWLEVELEREVRVNTVRLTGILTTKTIDSLRANPLLIEVDGQRCINADGDETGSWAIPKGQVTDCVCSQPLTGRVVRIRAPGSGRILQLCEVEVFDTQYAANPQCYNGRRYPDMAACERCIGPGPSQCTKCTEGYALIPWRLHNGAFQGSCRAFASNGIELQSIDGKAPISTKWGVQQDYVQLPAAANLFNGRKDKQWVKVEVQCLVLKYVWCEPWRRDGSDSESKTKCQTQKSVQLQSIPYIAFDRSGPLLNHAYMQLLLPQPSRHSWAGYKDLPIDYLTEFADIPSLDSACINIIKLL